MSARRSHGVRVRTVALMVAIPLVLLLVPARLTTPLRTAFMDGMSAVSGPVFRAAGDAAATGGTLTDMFLTEQRQRLTRARTKELKNRLEEARAQVERQKRHLRNVSGLEAPADTYRFVGAGVTAYDASALRAGITVGVGTSDGVRSGQAVTALGALVGVVESVGRWHSTVRLLTDPKSAVSARVRRTRRLCVVEGGGTDTLNVRWVNRREEVKKGDVLMTACLGELGDGPCAVPEGLPLATVKSVGAEARFPLFQSVTAAPRVDVSRLEWVQVLVPRQDDGD